MSYIFSSLNSSTKRGRTEATLDVENQQNDSSVYKPNRSYECKTCSRRFPTFQALGGHRASHKKPRLVIGDGLSLDSKNQGLQLKLKGHECLICGQEFPIGQALGGHMRRHRSTVREHPLLSASEELPTQQMPTVKKTNSRRFLFLDLNLPPLENDLNYQVRFSL